MLTVGSLFAGIGGFDLGFERAGMRTLWQVEQSEFCRRVLARHFPEAHRFNDVRDVTGDPWRWAEHGGTLLEYVDVLCGGFPCQDISLAGTGAGLDGERSGLWSEYARLIGELRPRYVVVENVAALLVRGLGRVLADLAALRYDAEWCCIPASAAGAPHERDRFWLVAYPDSGYGKPRLGAVEDGSAPVRERDGRTRLDAYRGSWMEGPPEDVRVAYGLPDWVDRNTALGNALVPQIAEWIGRRIVQYEEGGVAA